MLLQQHSDGPITVITAITLVGVVMLGLGMAAYLTSLGASRLVSLLAIPVAVATGIAPGPPRRLSTGGLRARHAGSLFVALALDWMRRRDWRSLACAALIAAVLSQVHGIAAVTAAVARVGSRPRHADQGDAGRAAQTSGAGNRCVRGCGLGDRCDIPRGVRNGPLWRTCRPGRPSRPDVGVLSGSQESQPSLPPGNVSMIAGTLQGMYEQPLWWIAPAVVLAAVGPGCGVATRSYAGCLDSRPWRWSGWAPSRPSSCSAGRVRPAAHRGIADGARGESARAAVRGDWVRHVSPGAARAKRPRHLPATRLRIKAALGLLTVCALVTYACSRRDMTVTRPRRATSSQPGSRCP